MKRRLRLLFVLFFPLALAMFSISPVFAATVQLTGTVTDGSGHAISGATVAALDPPTSATVTSATTDSGGNYTLSLAQGTYNIQVTPPAGSGLTPAIALNQTITSNSILNFALVPAGSVSLSGHIFDSQGNPLGNLPVQLADVSGHQTNGATDASGFYSLQVAPGNYHLLIRNPGMSYPMAAPFFTVGTSCGTCLALNQSTFLDLTLPFQQVSVHVQDPAGNAVANATLMTNIPQNLNPFPNLPVLAVTSSYQSSGGQSLAAATDNAGNVTLWLFPTDSASANDQYTFSVVPPTGSGLVATSLSGVTFTANTSLTITLPAPITLSGHIYDGQGNPLGNLPVQLADVSGHQTNGATDASGFYALQVAPGNYHLQISNQGTPFAMAAPFFSFFTPCGTCLALTQNTTLDLTLPFKQVSVHVQDPAGNPIANAGIATNLPTNANLVPGTPTLAGESDYRSITTTPPQYFATTDASGNATLWLFPTDSTNANDQYLFTVTPPSGSSFLTTTLSGVTFTTATSVTITMMAPVTLSGHVLDAQGNPLAGLSVTLAGVSGNQITTSTDASGFYSLQATPGNYNLSIKNQGTSFAMAAPFFSFFTPCGTCLALTQNTTLDLTLPFKQVSVHVQDPAGNPVANAGIATNLPTNANLVPGTPTLAGESDYRSITTTPPQYFATTDASGNATLWLFPTDSTNANDQYLFTVVPPSGSPFATVSVSNITFTSSITEVIVLQFVHAPPVTTIAVTPSPNAQGNYPNPVTVTLSASAATNFSVAATYYTVDGGATQMYSAPFTVSGNGAHTITYWSVDNLGIFELANTFTFTIQANTPPTVGPIAAPTVPVAINATVAASAPFTDPDTLDTHTAIWTWGDGATSTGAVNESNGSGQVTGNHTYTTPGVYTLTLTVTDNHGGVGTAQYQYVVVYNPARSLSGLGAINSPAGSYTPNPSLAGTLKFNFSTYYPKGTTTPSCTTIIEFPAASFKFQALTCQWLVINGAQGEYYGAGTINGKGTYNFQITVIDGQQPGGGGVDKIRIQIWDSTGKVIYDNQPGAPNTAIPTQAISSGAIEIH